MPARGRYANPSDLDRTSKRISILLSALPSFRGRARATIVEAYGRLVAPRTFLVSTSAAAERFR